VFLKLLLAKKVASKGFKFNPGKGVGKDGKGLGFLWWGVSLGFWVNNFLPGGWMAKVGLAIITPIQTSTRTLLELRLSP